MALDDYLEPEVAIAVAVTAAVASPPVRKVIRRGLVYGLAGLLIARDKVVSAAGQVASAARQEAHEAGGEQQAERPEPATQGAAG
jgi:hypothetical protein